MKRILMLMLPLVFVSITLAAQSTKATLKVGSYNVRNGQGLDDVLDLNRTARVIMAMGADVVAVQELDSVTSRSENRDILSELATLTSMKATYGKAIDFDGGAYGIGILSRETPLRVQRISLPGREERRALLVAEFADYVFMATHLSLTAQDQTESLKIMTDLASKTGKAVIVAGDFNFKPDSEQFKLLNETFYPLTSSKSATFPADKPVDCIDYIAGFVGGQYYFRVNSAKVVDAPVESDHRPIFAEFEFGTILRTNPYLQNPTNGGITISWQTNTPAHSWVEWGEDSTQLTKVQTLLAGQVIANNEVNKIRVEGLSAGRKYFYRIHSREIISYGAYSKKFGGEYVSPFYSFRLPDSKEGDFTAIVFNDLHQRRETINALMRVVADRPYDFVVFNGDCIDDPETQSQAINSISFFNNAVQACEKPVIYIRGNHEIRGAFSMNFTTLFDYAGSKSYGAFSWGDTRIVMLDCGEDKPDDHWVYYGLNDFDGFRKEQKEFLQREHRSAEYRKAAKRILIHHIPLWGLDEDYNPCRDLWGEQIEKSPYNIILNGHTHQFAQHTAGGSRIPVVIGGGFKLEEATVMILAKKGANMTLECYGADGREMLRLNNL